jgi:hypothetical protein
VRYTVVYIQLYIQLRYTRSVRDDPVSGCDTRLWEHLVRYTVDMSSRRVGGPHGTGIWSSCDVGDSL